MRLLCCVTAAMMLAAGLSARADNMETFNVSGTFTDSTTVSGTAVIDTTTGVFESADVSYLGMTFDVLTAVGPQPAEGLYEALVSTSSGTFPAIDFAIVGDNLVGFNGGPFCSINHPCLDGSIEFLSAYEASLGSNDLFLQTGTLAPAAATVTPEPSSVALLATGLLGFGVMMRRRFLS